MTHRPNGPAISRILVLACGGTISMQSIGEGQGAIPQTHVDQLLATIEPTASDTEIVGENAGLLPGAHLRFDDVMALCERIATAVESDGFDGVVVSQGTDTLEEVGFLLDLLLDLDAPVVLTGAMRHLGQRSPDGAANLSAAVLCAGCAQIAQLGVVIVMNDEIHAARYVAKQHTSGLGAFGSSPFGPVGRTVEGKVKLSAVPPRLPYLRPRSTFGRVAVLPAVLGDDGEILQAASSFDGLIVEAMGVGHVPLTWRAPLIGLAQDIPVVLASRTGAGPTFESTYGFLGAEQDLLAHGLISAGDLNALQARLLLLAAMAAQLSPTEIRQAFSRAKLGPDLHGPRR